MEPHHPLPAPSLYVILGKTLSPGLSFPTYNRGLNKGPSEIQPGRIPTELEEGREIETDPNIVFS